MFCLKLKGLIFTLMKKTPLVFPVNFYMKQSTIAATETARQQKFHSHTAITLLHSHCYCILTPKKNYQQTDNKL